MFTLSDFTSLFSRFRLNGQIAQAKEAGANHADQLADAYVDGFSRRMSERLQSSQAALMGGDEPKKITVRKGK